MNNIQRGVLTLVKSAITGEAAALPEGFTIGAAEKLIMRHRIESIAFEGAVLCGISKAGSTMQRLVNRYYQDIVLDGRQMTALDKLFAAFEANGIHYLPLKGSNMKLMYPNTAMRSMGDADILIKMDQYDRTRALMEELGYNEGPAVNHELVWTNEALYVELHKSLVPESSAAYYRYFGEGWQNAQLVAGNRYTLPNEIMFAFLLAHFAKHYQAAGVGLRQAVDLWIYIKKVPMDQEILLRELKKLDLVEFYQNICNVLDGWFEDKPLDEKTEFMSQYLFDCGVFGNKDNWIIGQALLSSKQKGSVKKARFHMIVEAIFPTMQAMQRRYSVLKKCPCLIPVYYPVRWVEAVLFRRNNIKNYAYDIKKSSAENIDTQEKLLQYVGLKMDV